jgi:hypothetical protein
MRSPIFFFPLTLLRFCMLTGDMCLVVFGLRSYKPLSIFGQCKLNERIFVVVAVGPMDVFLLLHFCTGIVEKTGPELELICRLQRFFLNLRPWRYS